MSHQSTRHLVMPTVASGIFMAIYLLLRPYGDAESSTSVEAAAAYASTRWVVAHLAGVLALAQIARIGLRINDIHNTTTSTIARWTGLAGVVLVLPFYGLEAFGLHVAGKAGLNDSTALRLVDEMHGVPLAGATFAIGLVLIAVSPVCVALAWRGTPRSNVRAVTPWVVWLWAVVAALFALQYLLPPMGRMAYGVIYAVLAVAFATQAWQAGRAGLRKS